MDNQILDEGFNNSEDASFDVQTTKRINLIKIELNEDIKHIKNARTTFIVLACLLVLGTALSLSFMNDGMVSATEMIIQLIVLVSIYIACAVGIRYNPKVAIIIGFSIYGILILINALVDISTVYQGIIVKLIVIMFLSRGVQGAFGFNKKLEKLYRLGVPVSDIEQAKRLEYVSHT